MIALKAEVLSEHLLPLVLSVVFHLDAEHQQGQLPMVSLSLDHFDADTSNPCHANILLVMRNGHTVLAVSSVRQ